MGDLNEPDDLAYLFDRDSEILIGQLKNYELQFHGTAFFHISLIGKKCLDYIMVGKDTSKSRVLVELQHSCCPVAK